MARVYISVELKRLVIQRLAYACWTCNLNKGTDLGSMSPRTGELVRCYNPRRDSWQDHFRLEWARIEPLTDIAEATARIFQLNDEDRILERQLLIEVNRYP